MAEQDNHQQPQPQPPRSQSENEAAAGIFPSHGISINLPEAGRSSRPHPVKHMSAPTYQSPIRHHRRAPSKSKDVKETLNARSHYGSGDDDGAAVHRINQYIIKQEIGRGSFGAVHLATDQYGNEFVRLPTAPVAGGRMRACLIWVIGLAPSALTTVRRHRLSKNSPSPVCGSAHSRISSANRTNSDGRATSQQGSGSIHRYTASRRRTKYSKPGTTTRSA